MRSFTMYFCCMAGNTFGQIFRLTSFGESHGPAIGGVIDGCIPGFRLDIEAIQRQLQRRKPGQSALSTPRKEEDSLEWLSGIFEGFTLGSPIAFLIRNKDARSSDYDSLKDVFRPSHADYSYVARYGLRDYRGGGRASARETIARVVAGSIAEQILSTLGIRIVAWVSQIGPVVMPENEKLWLRDEVDQSIVRCPDLMISPVMEDYLRQLLDEGDTTGGIISSAIVGVPAGWGEPVFDKLHADLGKAMLSINAVKGFSIGSGFASVSMKGSQHNDAFESIEGRTSTITNHSGGIQGGISNGEHIRFDVAFKPVASIKKTQSTIDESGNSREISIQGRHDPCVVPRAVPIVEAMAAMVLLDHALRTQTLKLNS
jgi:chorismate synthase